MSQQNRRYIVHILRAVLLATTVALTSSAALAQEDYPNEPLLLERMTLACPGALNLTKAGSMFFYKLADFATSIEVEECFSQTIDDHLENPWPVNTTDSPEATKVHVKPDGTIVLTN